MPSYPDAHSPGFKVRGFRSTGQRFTPVSSDNDSLLAEEYKRILALFGHAEVKVSFDAAAPIRIDLIATSSYRKTFKIPDDATHI